MRDKRVTTLQRNLRGIAITGPRLYLTGYTSGVPEGPGDNSPTLERWEQSANRPSPEGTAEIHSSRKTYCSFSRPFGTHAIWNSPPNVENVGLFSAVPPGQRKPIDFCGRKTFLMVTILTCTGRRKEADFGAKNISASLPRWLRLLGRFLNSPCTSGCFLRFASTAPITER